MAREPATRRRAPTLLGGTAEPSNGGTVMRNLGANIVLTSEDEWYKAAYYSALSTSYFDYPAGTDTQTTCAAPTATANRANCNNAVGDLTSVGSYTGSGSPYGTFDQGGNVVEWTEPIGEGSTLRVVRGGAFVSGPGNFNASFQSTNPATGEFFSVGFRIAVIPERPRAF